MIELRESQLAGFVGAQCRYVAWGSTRFFEISSAVLDAGQLVFEPRWRFVRDGEGEWVSEGRKPILLAIERFGELPSHCRGESVQFAMEGSRGARLHVFAHEFPMFDGNLGCLLRAEAVRQPLHQRYKRPLTDRRAERDLLHPTSFTVGMFNRRK